MALFVDNARIAVVQARYTTDVVVGNRRTDLKLEKLSWRIFELKLGERRRILSPRLPKLARVSGLIARSLLLRPMLRA